MLTNTEHLPAVVVKTGFSSLAAAFAAVDCPPDLAGKAAAELSEASPAVVGSLASYRAAGGQALDGGLWSADHPARVLLVAFAEPGGEGFSLACGLQRYARLDAAEAEAVVREFADRTEARWLLIERPHWPAVADAVEALF